MGDEEYNMAEKIREDLKLPQYIKKPKHEMVPYDYAAVLKAEQENWDDNEKEVRKYFEPIFKKEMKECIGDSCTVLSEEELEKKLVATV